MPKIPVTITIDPQKWKLFQTLSKEKLGKKASPHVEQLVDKCIAEMQGTNPDPASLEADLSNQHETLKSRAAALRRTLREYGTYEELNTLLRDLGLNLVTFAEADEVIDKLSDAMDAGTLDFTDSDVLTIIKLVKIDVQIHAITEKLKDRLREDRENRGKK
ncbi:MAG: hypothetical protein ABSE15_00490 [Candidatus Bathyarchaeia archaeon]|jgi:hypothetical protein